MAGFVLFVLIVLIGVAGVAAGVVGLARHPQRADVTQRADVPRAGADDGDLRSAAATVLLHRLSARLERGNRRQVVALAAPGDRSAVRELTVLCANVRAEHIGHLSMRYVDEDDGALGPAARRALGEDAWVGRVQLAWRIEGFDHRDSSMEVPMTFRRSGTHATFVSARHRHGDAAPLWLLGTVRVERTARSLAVTTADTSPRRFSGLAAQAVRVVRKVLPHWQGGLVVEVPRDQHELNEVLGSEPGDYSEIAAVTTTVDGSVSRAAPVHVFVNPRVFDLLGPRGSQIVLSHEATHVAVHAATSTMPTWLLEGFADYVALDHVRLPVSVTASQILAQVRRSGAPTHLPGKVEFDPQNKALGASYEAAWLACRLLGKTYGERRLVAFYRAADRASSTTSPFRTMLGTDQRTFTRAWRADLTSLAGR